MPAKKDDPREGESKRDRFLRIAEGRTNRALDAIRTLNNLSNRSAYDWDEQDIRKITRALRSAIADLENNFATKSTKADSRFRLT